MNLPLDKAMLLLQVTVARHCDKKLEERRTAYGLQPFTGPLRVTNPVQ